MNFKKTVGFSVLGLALFGAGFFIASKIKRHHKFLEDITSTTTVTPGLANNNPPILITMAPSGNDAIVTQYSNYANTRIYFTVTSGNANMVHIDSVMPPYANPFRYYLISTKETISPTTITVTVFKDPNAPFTNIAPIPNTRTGFTYTGGYSTDNNYSVVLAGDVECF